MNRSDGTTQDVAVTVMGAAPDTDGCWAVVDTDGRALRLPQAALDPRLATLHPGQRLRVGVTPDGRLVDGRL